MPGYSFLFGGIGDRKGQCRKCDLASADTDLKLQGLQSWAYLHLMHWFSGRDAPGKTIVGGAGCGGTGLWRKSTESAGWGGTVPRQQAEAFICLFVVIHIFWFLAVLRGLQNLSSPTGDQTHAPSSGSAV